MHKGVREHRGRNTSHPMSTGKAVTLDLSLQPMRSSTAGEMQSLQRGKLTAGWVGDGITWHLSELSGRRGSRVMNVNIKRQKQKKPKW